MEKSIALIAAGIFLASGCTSMSIDEFESEGPAFVLEEFFEGKTRARGLFEDRLGAIRRQFVVDITGQWDGKTLILTEDFLYNDGETETRQWTITKTAPNSYRGTTNQAIGYAVGKAAGNAFNWEYDFNLEVGDSTWKVHFNDWMFLQPDGAMLNKATVSRWGFKIGTVFLSFDKSPETDSSQPLAVESSVPLELA